MTSIRRSLALEALSSCLLPSTKRLRHSPAGGMLSIFGEAVTIEQCVCVRRKKSRNQGILFHEHDTCVPSYCERLGKQPIGPCAQSSCKPYSL